MIGVVFWSAVALVGYTLVGYPVLVTVAGALRSAPRHRPFFPKITLIVAAYDEEAVIGERLVSIDRLDYPRELLQVIVAADGSTDRTAQIAAAHDGVEVVHRPERAGKMAALERAAEWATGDVLVFSDANNRFETDALRLLVEPFATETVGMVTGRKMVLGEGGIALGEGAYWRYEAHLRRMETRLGCTVGVNGEILAIRRDLFERAPAGTINDDQWLAQRVIGQGLNVVFRDEAVSTEPAEASAASAAERRSRIVAGQLQSLSPRTIPWRRPLVAWMTISHKFLRPTVGPALVVALVASVLGVIVDPRGGPGALSRSWAALALGAQVAFYFGAALGDRLPGPVGRLARFFIVEQLATARGIWRHLTRSQAATWDKAERVTS